MPKGNEEDLLEKRIDLAEPFVEIAIDKLLDDDLLKDVPIVGVVKSIFKSAQNVRDYFFMKRLSMFLFELHNQNAEEINDLILKFNKSKDRERTIDKLIIVIERLDDFDKAKMMAYAFDAYLKSKIDRETLTRFWHIIDRVFIEDLCSLLKIDKDYKLNTGTTANESLFNAGLVVHVIEETGAWVGGPKKIFYSVSNLGEIFIKHVVSRWDIKDSF